VAPAQCGGPSLLVSESIALRRAQQHFARARTLTILAVGSGSTAGTGASNREAAWPARLAVALALKFPQAQIAVVNRAQPRQTARTIYQKLPEEVASVRPQLVIWETGTADAVQQYDVDRFAQTLVRGIDRLDAAGIDAILLDPQYERIATRLINFEPYLEAIQRVATMRDVGVFQRHALMRDWAEANSFDFEGASGAERLRVADAAYDCIGRLLADAIARAIR
jgi:lysophospholipase L1-like esterase